MLISEPNSARTGQNLLLAIFLHWLCLSLESLSLLFSHTEMRGKPRRILYAFSGLELCTCSKSIGNYWNFLTKKCNWNDIKPMRLNYDIKLIFFSKLGLRFILWGDTTVNVKTLHLSRNLELELQRVNAKNKNKPLKVNALQNALHKKQWLKSSY